MIASYNYEDADNFADEIYYILFYDEVKNIMVDEGGFMIFDIFSIISPNVYYLFKYHKEDMITRDKKGNIIELIWPEHDET